MRNSSLILGCQQPPFSMAVWPCGGTGHNQVVIGHLRNQVKKNRGWIIKACRKSSDLKIQKEKWLASLTKHSLNGKRTNVKQQMRPSSSSNVLSCVIARDHSSSSHFLDAKISQKKPAPSTAPYTQTQNTRNLKSHSVEVSLELWKPGAAVNLYMLSRNLSTNLACYGEADQTNKR